MAASGSGSSTAPAPTSSDGMNPVPFLFIDLLLRHLFIPKEKVFPHWFYPRTILVLTMVSASLEHRSSSGKKDDQIRCGSKSRDGLFSNRKEIESLTLAQLRKTAGSTGFLSAARFAACREQKERKGLNPVGFNLTLNAKRNSLFLGLPPKDLPGFTARPHGHSTVACSAAGEHAHRRGAMWSRHHP